MLKKWREDFEWRGNVCTPGNRRDAGLAPLYVVAGGMMLRFERSAKTTTLTALAFSADSSYKNHLSMV
jgi:hypothetical protein